jgi:peptidoglycan/LPS O-acetylase OafA/YrhL
MMERPMRPRSDRLFSLDVLRGVAALTVVFWHWQHFALIAPDAPGRAFRMPFYPTFPVFYRGGWLAVDLFFALSGFVFFWLYADAVHERRLGARDFFILRVSRVYPLHLATLLAVAAEQAIFRAVSGHEFAYGINDGYHFLLNLGLASSWGFERGLSFNIPVWSVSVEAALYATFFGLCRMVRPRLPLLIGLSVLGFVGVARIYIPIGRGMGGFFLGGTMYLVYEWLVTRGWARLVAPVLGVAMAAAWVYVLLPRSAARHGVAYWRAAHISDYWPATVVLFPLTILGLALVETQRGTLGRRVSFLGDLSYASYLLHFPLQLTVAIVVVSSGVDPGVLSSRGFFVGFFAVVIATSLASYRWFEAPVQRWIRRGSQKFLYTISGAP